MEDLVAKTMLYLLLGCPDLDRGYRLAIKRSGACQGVTDWNRSLAPVRAVSVWTGVRFRESRPGQTLNGMPESREPRANLWKCSKMWAPPHHKLKYGYACARVCVVREGGGRTRACFNGLIPFAKHSYGTKNRTAALMRGTELTEDRRQGFILLSLAEFANILILVNSVNVFGRRHHPKH